MLRPTWQVVCLTLVLAVLIVVAAGWFLFTTARPADPIIVGFAGLSAEVEKQIQVRYAGRDNTIFLMQRVESTSFWYLPETWVRGLWIIISPSELANLEKIKIILGHEESTFSRQQIVEEWDKKNLGPQLVLTVPNVFERRSSLPGMDPAPWNWPGDKTYILAVWNYSVTPILLVVLAGFFLGRRRTEGDKDWWRAMLGITSANARDVAAKPGVREKTWNCVGLAFLAAALIFLEVRTPYFFTQDDNLVDCLPLILAGCQEFWQGNFPHYNPYSFLGAPLASLGMYGLTYPPLVLAYALARHGLGNEHATLEVFAVLHLAAGFFLTRLLGRKLGLATMTANLVALSFVLSGPVLIMGRCWFQFLPVVVWLPALFLGLVALRQGSISRFWLIGMGLAAGLPFHVGFSQAAVYINACFCLAVLYLVLTGGLAWSQAARVIPPLLIGAGVALPVVYQQLHLAQSNLRLAPPGEGIGCGLAALFLPFPLAQAQAPTGWGNVNRQYMGHLYFFGGLLAFFFVLQVVGLFFFRPGKKQWSGQVWTVCALLIFWLALGDAGGLWWLVARLPGLGFINRYPMRLLPFLVFFVCLAGGLVLDRVLQELKPRRCWGCLLAGTGFFLLALHVCNCRSAFYHYGFRPYPEFPTLMEETFRPAGKLQTRVCSWGPQHSMSSNYPFLLGYNLPVVYQVPALDGYNSLLEGNPLWVKVSQLLQAEGPAALRAYGVRWHLCRAPGQLPPISSPFNHFWFLEVMTKNDALYRRLAPEKFPQVFAPENHGVRITELTGVDPLAFVNQQPERPLPVQVHGRGIDVDISQIQAPAQVVVNFLCRPEMQTDVDGQPVSCLPDRWYRIVVSVPGGGQVLSIRLAPSWTRGLLLGLAFFILGVGLGKKGLVLKGSCER